MCWSLIAITYDTTCPGVTLRCLVLLVVGVACLFGFFLSVVFVWFLFLKYSYSICEYDPAGTAKFLRGEKHGSILTAAEMPSSEREDI